MTNLDRLLEKSRKEREALRNNFSPRVYEYHTNPEDEFKDEIITIAVEALNKLEGINMPSASTGEYCTADITLPADEALRKIEALAAKALGESES